MNSRTILSFPSFLQLFIGALLFLSPAWAVDYTWTGLGAANTWNDPANWNPNTGSPGSADTATFNDGSTANIDDAVPGFTQLTITSGRVNLNNVGNTSTGTIIVNAGATLGAAAEGASGAMGDASVLLNGGVLEFLPGNISTINGLAETWYNLSPNGNDLRINPLTFANGDSLLNQVPDSTQVLDVPLSWNSDGALNTRSGGVTGNNNICALWLGQMNVGTNGSPLVAGDLSFGTRSDDGSALFIDGNQNGIFESPSELIVNNLGYHGQVNRVGNTNLAAGVYDIGIGFFEAGGGAGMHARFFQGIEGNYDNMTLINPQDAAQDGLWTIDVVAAGDLNNNINLAASSTIRLSADIPGSSVGDLAFNGPHTLTVDSLGLNQPLDVNGSVSLSGDAAFVQLGQAKVTLPAITELSASGLTQDGDGCLILTANNDHTGLTIVNGGVLEVQANGALGDIGAGTIVNTNGALVLNAPGNLNYAEQEPLELNGSGNAKARGALTHTAGNNDDYRGPITLGSDAMIYNQNNQLSLFGLIDIASNELQLVSDNNNIEIEGSGGITGAGDVVADGVNGRIITFNNNGKTDFDGLLTINNIIWDSRSNDSLGSTNGATVVNSGGRLELRDGRTWGEDITIFGNDNGAGAIRSENNLNTLTGTVTLGDGAMIWVNPTQLTITGDLTGPFTAQKFGTGMLILDGDNTMGGIIPAQGTLRVNSEGGLGGTDSLLVPLAGTVEFADGLSFDGSSPLQSIQVAGGTLSAFNDTTTIDVPVVLDAGFGINFAGDGNLIVEQDFGTAGVVSNVTTDALNHLGFHVNNDGMLDLNNNGGILNQGVPTNHPNFYAATLLTAGPGGRGLDFNDDNDFINSGAINQTDNYMNMWIGVINCNETGTWGFRNAGDDDRAGIWLDRNTNLVFESTQNGLGSNRGEQLSWEDGGNKQVTLTNGVSYLIAFTHREGGGGSRADFRFTRPGGTETIIQPFSQPGLWSPAQAGEAEARNAVVKSGNGTVWFNGNNGYTEGTTITGGAIAPVNVDAIGGAGSDVTIFGGTLALNGGNTFDLGAVEISGAGGANWSGALHNIDGDNHLISTNLFTRETIVNGSSMGIASADGSLTVDAPGLELDYAQLVFDGAGDVIFNPDILTSELTTVTDSNVLYHFGYHERNDGVFMDLDGNGGMMGGGDPRTFQSFFNFSRLTDGPGNRGLDFNNDADFINTGSIGQNDNYHNLWLGEFRPDQTGLYGFRNAGDDDRSGMWLDLNQNGVFESTQAGLGSNRGEQLQWEDTANHEVDLIAGQRYRVAFTHGEGGGGSRADFRFTPPGGSEVIIKPSDPAQSGLWHWADLIPENTVVKNGSGHVTLNGSNTHIGATVINGGTLVVPDSAALGTLDAGTIIGEDGTLALTNNVTLAGESLWLSGNITGLGDDNTIDIASVINVASNTSVIGIGALSGSLTVDGPVDLVAARLQVDGDGDTSLNGIVSGLGSGASTPPPPFAAPFTFDAVGPTNYMSDGWTVTSGFVGGHNQNDGELGALSAWVNDTNPGYAWDVLHPTVLASSPPFLLDGSDAPITFELHGGTGNVGAAPTNVAEVLAITNSLPNGAQGLGLRRVDTGAYVLTAFRSGNGATDEDFSWATTGLEDTVYTVDFFDFYHGGWGWVDVDNVVIPGLNLNESITVDNSITKTGSGTLTLAAANSYDGDTRAWGGILMISGSTDTGTVSVADATLMGTGPIGGDVIVASRGQSNPGASVGTLTVNGDLRYDNYSSVFNAELDSAASYDLMAVTGDIVLSNATLNLIKDPGYSPTATDVLTIATGNSVDGTFNGIAEGERISANGAEFVVSYLNDAITLNATAGLYTYAERDTVSRLADSPAMVPASQLLGNDLAGDGVAGLSITGVSATSIEGGTVSFDGTTVTYTPPVPDTNGPDSFTYMVTDGTDVAIGLVTVVVSDSAPGIPPVLDLGGSMLLPNGDYRIAFSGTPGETYDIEWTQDISTLPIVWQVLDTVIAAGDGSIVTDHALPPGEVNYYRAAQQ